MTKDDVYIGNICIVIHENHSRPAITIRVWGLFISKYVGVQFRAGGKSVAVNPNDMENLDKDVYV